jgi:tetratricopeptide (TPR) repeat protein
MDVELLDEFERLIRSTTTGGSGLYFFQGIKQGNYYVQVRVDGTDYLPAKERIQLGEGNRISATGQSTGGESVQINFSLVPRRGAAPSRTPLNDVVFAQEVPEAAKISFERAERLLADKKSGEAIKVLEAALDVFPEYYLALDKLGFEYLNEADFEQAERIFDRELKVNPKSISAKSGLGVTQFKLGKMEEAVKTLEQAVVGNPSSAPTFLFLGKIYRELREYQKAEKVLLKARGLDQNSSDIHWELALLYYYNLNRHSNAAEELEAYLKTDPKSSNRPQIEKLIKKIRTGNDK